jgi:peptidoglycan/xylan/chitin deacetylase (PgdA/CDA1 family)
MLKFVRSAAAPLLKTALLRSGGFAALRRAKPSRQVAILRYHAICGDEGHAYADPLICISPEAFSTHVRYLASNYRVLPMSDVVAAFREGSSLPDNTIVITFDDGYADNLAAARTLHASGISGTFFVTSECLQGGLPFWPSELRTLIPAIAGPELRLDVAGAPVVVPFATEEDRRHAIKRVNRIFKSNSIPVRESLRAQLRTLAGNPPVSNPMLSWEQLAEMHRLGMTIGAHTMTHPNLPSAGLDAATAEIQGAKERLERELNQPVTMFSYPNGGAEQYYTPELQRVVAKHYAAAASSRNAFAGPRSDLYALERIEVEERLEDLVFALEVERFAFRPTGDGPALGHKDSLDRLKSGSRG